MWKGTVPAKKIPIVWYFRKNNKPVILHREIKSGIREIITI
jgi:hypothetical protein